MNDVSDVHQTRHVNRVIMLCMRFWLTKYHTALLNLLGHFWESLPAGRKK